MKRFCLLLIIALLTSINANAVLKEKDLGKTIHVLRLELENQLTRQKERMKMLKARNSEQHSKLASIMERSNKASLMLYSQSQDYTFDVAYACQEAIILYRELGANTMPYDRIKTNINNEIERYDSLIYALQTIPPFLINIKGEPDIHNAADIIGHAAHEHNGSEGESHAPISLNKQGREDRTVCIRIAKELQSNLKSVYEQLSEDQEHYERLSNRIENMFNYAQKKYVELQQSFLNGGTNYFVVLSRLPNQINRMQSDFTMKYKPLLDDKADNNGNKQVYKSEWRGGIVIFAGIFILIYTFIASLLSNALLRWAIPKRYQTENYRKKRPLFIVTLAIFLFVFVVLILRNWIHHNMMIMATKLMVEIAWLIGTIYFSMLIRLKNSQIKSGIKIYVPFIIMASIVICFRIILIPNIVVNVIFPPILLIFTIWQIIMLKKCNKDVPHGDKLCCSISLASMVIATIASWAGYTLIAILIMIWWMFQLAAIATITCVYDIMEMYEDRFLVSRIKKEHPEMTETDALRKLKRGDFVSKTWIYDFFNRALVPVGAVISIPFCIIMAADIFNLRALCFKWFMYSIPIPKIMEISLGKVFFIVILFYIFKYVNYLIRSAWFGYRRTRGNSKFNATLARNIIGLITWGIYSIMIFIMLDVPSAGVTYLGTGLTAGLGFASKSLLENFFYGISLMSGRVRVGDYIECDGITGKVESITYQSTQIITLDGSVVAILNSELFTKNFKNLTRNHQYELVKIPFGIAYGTNVEKVRNLIIDGLSPLCKQTEDGRDIVSKKHKIEVLFSDFGASSVDLFLVAWVLVDQRIIFTGKAKEKIYQVLNENNIEIPFPQQDIYIRSIAKTD